MGRGEAERGEPGRDETWLFVLPTPSRPKDVELLADKCIFWKKFVRGPQKELTAKMDSLSTAHDSFFEHMDVMERICTMKPDSYRSDCAAIQEAKSKSNLDPWLLEVLALMAEGEPAKKKPK